MQTGLRVDSIISSHSVFKIPSVLGVFVNRLCEVIFEPTLKRIADKARQEENLKFTSLAHHITEQMVWDSLRHTPQGGSISVILSNIYLHYVLDLWFEKAVKPRLKGEAYLVRYLDDFIVCFQHRKDALMFQRVLVKRLSKFSLEIQPSKTKLVEFGRFAQRDAKKYKRKMQTVYFLGFTHFCKRNKRRNFMVGRKTEKSRLRRSIASLTETMRIVRHYSLKEQTTEINQILR